MLTRAALMFFVMPGGLLAPDVGPRLDLAQDDGGAAMQAEDPDGATAAGTDGDAAGPQALPQADPTRALPRCDALPAEASGLVDCTLDDAGTILGFDYEGTTEDARLTLTQSAPEGGERLISDPIRVTGVTLAPTLTDLDGDGSFELFLPVSRVGDETLFEVWMLDETYFFSRTDEIIAPAPESIAPRDGLLFLTVPDPEDPARSTETAMFLDPGGFTQLYSLAIDTGAETCTLIRAEGNATVNDAAIEADCADRLGFPPPEAAPPGLGDEVLTETPSPSPSPKSL